MALTQLEEVVQKSQRLSKRSKAQYLRDVRSFILFAGRDPKNWTGAKVQGWRDWLLSTKTMKPATVNNKMAALRYAAKRYSELYTNGPNFAKVAEFLPVAQTKNRKALQPEDAEAIIATCATNRPLDLRDRAILTLGFRTGIRREGLTNIDLEDLGKRNADGSRTITVILKAVPGQPAARHTFMMDPETAQALDPWINYMRRHGVAGGPLFRAVRKDAAKMARERVRPYGRAPKPVMAEPAFAPTRLSTSGLEKALKKRANVAGIKFHPHLMRHSLVSWLVAAEVPKARIMGVTGHRTERMIDTYTTDVLQDTNPVGNQLPSLGKKK